MRAIHPDDIQRLHRMLTETSAPVIVTHMKPDGDAMGSSIAMYHVLKMYGKSPRIATADPAPCSLDFLMQDTAEDILTYCISPGLTEKAIEESDLVICVDFNAFHRTDTLEKSLESSVAAKILIDHHLAPDLDRFTLAFSQTEVSSASELLYHILLALPVINGDVSRLPERAATALMTGMTTDTNNFSNSVYPSTFAMASSLIAAGVDRDMIISMLYNRFKESRIRLQGHVLKNLMAITGDGVAYIVLDRQTMHAYNVEEGDTEGFVNIPLAIGTVRMSILVKEDNGYARVSIRSKKGVSANRCSQLHFHGGGHENAAGGRLYFPADIEGIAQAAAYIEDHTHIFMTEEQ